MKHQGKHIGTRKRTAATDAQRVNKLREIAQDSGEEMQAAEVVTCTYLVHAVQKTARKTVMR